MNTFFFIKHGLHANADFKFIVNGEYKFKRWMPTDQTNIEVIRRKDNCYNIGSFGEVLMRNDQELVKKYSKFILMTNDIRGPFVPHWSNECWSDAYLRKVTAKTKVTTHVHQRRISWREC
jgi:hypothetical protein